MLVFIFCLIMFIVFMAMVVNNSDPNSKVNTQIKANNENISKDELSKLGDLKYVAFLNDGQNYGNSEYIAIIDDYIKVNFNNYKKDVKIKDILKLEVNYKIQEKNRMRFVAIMPTYDKHTKLAEIQFILYMNGINDIVLTLNGQSVNPHKIKKLQLMIENIKEGIYD